MVEEVLISIQHSCLKCVQFPICSVYSFCNLFLNSRFYSMYQQLLEGQEKIHLVTEMFTKLLQNLSAVCVGEYLYNVTVAKDSVS